MKFKNWNPQAGDRAVVPGGPACRRYVAKLTQEECDAILAGTAKGYAPIRISVVDGDEVLDTLVYNERYDVWQNNQSGHTRSPAVFLRAARKYFGKKNATLIAG